MCAQEGSGPEYGLSEVRSTRAEATYYAEILQDNRMQYAQDRAVDDLPRLDAQISCLFAIEVLPVGFIGNDYAETVNAQGRRCNTSVGSSPPVDTYL